ncbi:MAG TPA: IS21 family transposase [Verrucomicrobiota bacterium]|nr:IS21 family transposase [Verrucomicrobiota bacterium]
MVTMLDRVRIRALREAGHTLDEIAEAVGVGKSTVQRVLKEPRIASAESAPTPKSRRIGRPSRVEGLRSEVERILEAEPALPTVEVLSRLRSLGYTGGKSAAYELVKAMRPPAQQGPEVRFEGVPGEFSQHDFGSVNVSYADGSGEKIHFFASRLKYSRWTHVVTVPDERVESLIRALLQSFASFGGVPLRAVFDNPKTVVIGQINGAPEWNPTFAHVPVDYGFGVERCAPRRANQKGSVENLVGWVKGSFFKVRRFHDRQDLEQQLVAWLEEVNLRRPNRATNQVPMERMDAERARLSPMAIPAADYPLRIAVTVRTTGFVEYERIRYSMPPAALGIPATLFLYPDRVRIVARNGCEAEHPRRPAVGNTSYCSEHRVARLAAIHGERARLYQKRQEILELGPPAEKLLTEWVHHPRMNWKDQVEQLHDLLLSHGPQRTLQAIEDVLLNGHHHVKAITWILNRPLLVGEGRS